MRPGAPELLQNLDARENEASTVSNYLCRQLWLTLNGEELEIYGGRRVFVIDPDYVFPKDILFRK